MGLVAITESVEDDVFIVGYPKSGNTWFQYLVAGVIYGADTEYVPNTLLQELIPDVHYKRYYKRYWTPMFFKSHHLPRPDYRHVVYLLRDGRDVMVSYRHMLSAQRGEEIDFLTMVESGKGLFPCKWHEHVEAWLSNPYNTRMIIVKYEDLKRNTTQELRRFCAFVGVERDDVFLEWVAAQASFEKMHAKEREGRIFFENPRWPKNKHFFRRAVVGSYRDEMPPDVLDAFLHDATQTLQDCDYL